jgi:hypothetical protein
VHTRSVWGVSTALITGLALAVPLATAQAAPSLGTATAGAPAAPKSGTITLPTGDHVRVIVKPNGKPMILTRPAATKGPGRILVTQTRGSDQYVMPAIAEPYLGRLLDPGLFDVTRLLKAKQADGRVPVTLSYTGSRPSAPGVTITSASAGTAHGYLTPGSSVAFGKALAAQWSADSGAGWPQRSTLFGGVKKLSADLPGAPAGTVTPKYPEYTLIVKVIGPDGQPEPDGELGLINVDDSTKAYTYLPVVDGEVRISLPKGHYSAITDDFRQDEATGELHYRIAMASEFTFTATGQTVTLDLRQATVAPKVSTPKPGTLDGYTFDLFRSDGGEDALEYGVSTNDPIDFRYAPAKAATHGVLQTLQGWHLVGGTGSGAYSYDLATSANTIPSTPVFRFAADQLATIGSRYYSDGGKHNSEMIRTATYPSGLNTGIYTPVKLGSVRTEYVGATGKPTWFDELVIDADNLDDLGLVDVLDRTIAPGKQPSVNWLRGPIAAGFPRQTGDGSCYACRTSKQMLISLSTITDTNPYQAGDVDLSSDGLPVNRYRFYENGKKVYDEGDSAGDVIAAATGKATYRAIIDVDRRQTNPLQSTISQTDLSFSSSGTSGAKLPKNWYCYLADSCRVLPIVQAKLALPTDLEGRLPVGKATVTVTVAPIQNAGASAATSATLQIRPANNDWITVKLTSAGGGTYTGIVNNTADFAGVNVDVRFTGADKAGSTFKQTVLRAYTVAGS